MLGASTGGVTETARSCLVRLIMRGAIMSHGYQPTKNKQPKLYLQQYLYNSSEPRDITSNDTPADIEDKLLENSQYMRRQFRHTAQRMRSHYQ